MKTKNRTGNIVSTFSLSLSCFFLSFFFFFSLVGHSTEARLPRKEARDVVPPDDYRTENNNATE